MEIKVLRGKDDWLFLDNDSNDNIKQITGQRPLCDEELAQWIQTTTTRALEFKKRNIPHFFFVPPNKECLYSEYLPENITLSNNRPIFQLIESLDSPPIYLLEPLLKHKQDGILLYSQDDTHWNHYGAFKAYEHIAQIIGQTVNMRRLSAKDVSFTVDAVNEPDLGSKIGRTGSPKVLARFQERRAKLIYNNGVPQTGNYRIFECPRQPNLPVCVMFCDSFSWNIRDFFAESFSKLYLARLPHIDWGLVDKMKPDVVITELVERFLVRPPRDGIGTLKRLVLEKKERARQQLASKQAATIA